MAKNNVQEPVPPEPEPAGDADLDDREKPISDAASDDEGDYGDTTLTPEQREQRRLSRKPRIDHLMDGTATLDDGTVLPLFDVGDRIVAERHISFLTGAPWLDTRVYIVKSIDDETGAVHCPDEEMQHYACVGYKNPHTRIKLAAKKGDPFKVPKVAKVQPELPPGEKKRRGRPKGFKNRPREIIEAEKRAKKEEKNK